VREQEALLKEAHHRVKNNLQVITSLLRLESSRIEPPSTKAVRKDVQNRIQSMALLHETLYRSGKFAEVDLAAYLRVLAGHLALTLAPGQVELRLELAGVRVGLDQAIPCGLILNELLSNAFKRAFPDGRRGVVWVELNQKGGEDLRLCVRDDGIGVPGDFEARRDRSLGLPLVGDLIRQLQGRMETASGPGSTFEVTFSRASPEPHVG
jgi:two-component sensor histidine kinase